MTITVSTSVDLSINNMTKVLPATVGAQIATIISKSADFSIGNMTKGLPATARAQIAIIANQNHDSPNNL